MRLGRRAAPMTAMVQVDVTDALNGVANVGLFPTAHVLACVGRGFAEHPDTHVYLDCCQF